VTVALATSAEYPELDPDSQLLLPALAACGVDATPLIWTDPAIDWSAYDAVIVRSVWDYFERVDEFLAWVERVGPAARRFVNPPDVIAWNAHKTYLRDLGERGVPVVDTVWVERGERATVPFEEAVVKPSVSGGSIGLRRAQGGEEVVAGEDLMIQPLMRSIETEGEVSLLFAGGLLSHVVRKVPAAGDIRSQPEFGSDVTVESPTGEMLEASATVLAALGDDLPYARVDLVRAGDGSLRLIELEVIEPQLYLRWDAGSAVRFASALAAAARSA
jgi:glutathione synthase/RimK-type ligase-like ATP-grasp enzyme